MSFLAPHLKELKGNEQILDIGCGDGKITADISKFIPHGTILGLDPSVAMIDWACKQYHPTSYPNLHFQLGGFLDQNLCETYDLIVSFCALPHCQNQDLAFYQMALRLKPQGKLLLLVPAINNPAWSQARSRTQNSPKWNKYWKDYQPRKFLKPAEYEMLLECNHFRPIHIELVETPDPFINRQELLDWLMGTFYPAVPPELRAEFYGEWIDEYLKLNPEALRENGVIHIELSYITIEAEKI